MSRHAAAVACVAAGVVLGRPVALACSVFSVADGEGARVGRNLDWYPDSTGQVWFEPADAEQHAVVFFALNGEGFAQDGMNDQGLAFAGATIPEIELKEHEDRPNASCYLLMDVLRTCATVDEAVAMIEAHDLSACPSVFSYGHLMIVDAGGASAVLEGDTIVRAEASHQVMTNFCLSDPGLGSWPCGRYDLLEGELADGSPRSDEEVEELVFEARGSAWGGFTVYSQLFDLQDLTVTLWWESDRAHPVVIDLLAAAGSPRLQMEELWDAAVEAAEVDVPFLD